MKKKTLKAIALACAFCLTIPSTVMAAPAGAAAITGSLEDNGSKQTAGVSSRVADMVAKALLVDISFVENNLTGQVSATEASVSEFANVAVAQVNRYVNVRDLPSEESEIVGKLYNNSAASVLEEVDGWYYIKSGNCTGYVKSEYVVVGDEELARSVATRYATVTTETLFVRKEPSLDAPIIYWVPLNDDLVVVDESTVDLGWVLVNTEVGDGYVSTDYVKLSTEFVTAESKAEEEARLKKEAAAREKARAAAAKKAAEEAAKKAAEDAKKNASSTEQTKKTEVTYTATDNGSSSGAAVVQYGAQFVGNPYKYGGTSLTNGTDCSGFVKGVYSYFGVDLPRTSSSMRSVGTGVSYDEMQVGDIVCYSGHVGVYAGNGMLLHASNPSTGICYSDVNYRKILAIRRIF